MILILTKRYAPLGIAMDIAEMAEEGCRRCARPSNAPAPVNMLKFPIQSSLRCVRALISIPAGATCELMRLGMFVSATTAKQFGIIASMGARARLHVCTFCGLRQKQLCNLPISYYHSEQAPLAAIEHTRYTADADIAFGPAILNYK